MPETSKKTKLKINEPLDYLVVGHLTADLVDGDIQLGGTAAFSGLTASALGLRVGIVTSFANDLDTTPINSLWMKNKPSADSTTFRNLSDGKNRTQYLYHTAQPLTPNDLPAFDSAPEILHLGPMANEVDPNILSSFPHSLKCLTPQGWLRGVDENKQVAYKNWEQAEQALSQADIAIISLDDVQKDEDLIAWMAGLVPIFVVTENFNGARVYWHNDARYINAPEVKYQDDTGAGDIFATAFFYRYLYTKDPWEAGRFAVLLASRSVTRKHLNSIPLPEEIEQAKLELLHH